MEQPDDFDLDALLRELAEIGVGSAILTLRRINISRRKLVGDLPLLAPWVDLVIEGLEATAKPASAILGATVSGIGDVVAGQRGAQLNEIGLAIAELGPELLRLSGLTQRG